MGGLVNPELPVAEFYSLRLFGRALDYESRMLPDRLLTQQLMVVLIKVAA